MLGDDAIKSGPGAMQGPLLRYLANMRRTRNKLQDEFEEPKPVVLKAESRELRHDVAPTALCERVIYVREVWANMRIRLALAGMIPNDEV